MRAEYGHYIGDTEPWLVVNTHPHKEPFALANLEYQGFRAYCPRIRRRVRHARRWQDVLRPLFPGYLFVRLDPERQAWRSILSTCGVRTLVRSGSAPSLLDDGLIQSLRARETGGVIVKPAIPFAIDQKVKFSAGPFDGLVARVIDMDERDRIIVLLDMLNQSVKVRVDAGQLTEV